MLRSKTSSFAIRFCVLLIVLSLPPLPKAVASSSSQLSAPHIQSTWSNRYAILLSGVNSVSSGSAPLGGDFEIIERELIEAGYSNLNIVYFSYSATAKGNYCLGWKDACTPSQDLSYLHLFPVYREGDTKLKITHQAETLKWLIGQIIKKDPTAQIDLIGFSQGGIIAAYLASKLDSSSPLHPHIRGIITIESPLGGIPGASPCLDNPSNPRLCFFVRDYWGDELLTALQIPETLPGSLVDELPAAAENFRFTSIQSSTDYAVNSLTFPINWIGYGHQDALIGTGSQYWVNSRQTIHFTEELGGRGIATEYQSMLDVAPWITDNHFAPLRHNQTIAWILEAINDTTEGSPEEPSEELPVEPPEEPPSIPSVPWEDLQQQFLDWWQEQQENMEEGLDQWWQEQVVDRIEDALEQGWQDLQDQLVEWLWQQYAELLNQCFGSALLPTGALASVWVHRRRKGKFHK